MNSVVIDDRTRARFRNLTETLRFVDESGHLLGLFTPAADPSLLGPQIDEEEIQRRLAQRGGRPLAEILRDRNRPRKNAKVAKETNS